MDMVTSAGSAGGDVRDGAAVAAGRAARGGCGGNADVLGLAMGLPTRRRADLPRCEAWIRVAAAEALARGVGASLTAFVTHGSAAPQAASVSSVGGLVA